jgi:lysine biosynthesis protein LysW
MASCPECDADIDVDDVDLEEMETGDPWDCDSCGTRLRVGSLDPLEFDTDDDDDDDEVSTTNDDADDAEDNGDDDDDDDADSVDWDD